MPAEVELKFTLSPKLTASIARSPLLAGLATAKPTTRSLTSIYFDTPEADLRTAQLTLRLRRAGSRWWQAIKGGGSAAGGVHVRMESEHPVAAGELDLEKIDDARLRKKLGKWSTAGDLVPRFETVIRRTTWLLHTANGGVVECALDRGEVRTADRRRSSPVCEVELELKAGPPSTLFALARELASSVPLALEPHTKAERGYALWRRETLSKPSKAGTLLLDPHATAGDAMARIVGSGIDHLQRNWQAAMAILRYDPEHIHQMRVASRRLRTAFTLFGRIDTELKAHPVTPELRWLTDVLGEARNWDVLLAQTFPKLLATFPDEPALPALARSATVLRRRARSALREALRSERYASLVFSLSEFAVAVRGRSALGVPIVPFAADLLTRRHRQLRRRARHLTRLSAADRHALRIAAKKVRYAAEFFGSLFAGGKLDAFLRRFNQLQKKLGVLNDLATTRALMSELARGADADTQRALGLCTGWSAGLEQGSLTELSRCWKDVDRAARFWPP